MSKTAHGISKKYKILSLAVVSVIAIIAVLYIVVFNAKTPQGSAALTPDAATKEVDDALLSEDEIEYPDVVEMGHEPAITPAPNTNSNTIQTIITHGDHANDEEKAAGNEHELSDLHDSSERRIERYLEQIHAIQTLLTQFAQKTDYATALQAIDQHALPLEVKQILRNMALYQENHIKNASVGTKVFPQCGIIDKVVGRFVQITKLSPSDPAEGIEYDRIVKSIPVLTGYFFSKVFLKQVTAHD